ncbi:uncharacterized protein LOC132618103 [Lycium barbarum]|uniref:uncharacterized protein LOC132618103 n=1 Tax=Lycium barbarum TaxID=112863 RepID=UPI00293E223A|nr:uncharacterized protein LOC132618103 [Lycium barbarum]
MKGVYNNEEEDDDDDDDRTSFPHESSSSIFIVESMNPQVRLLGPETTKIITDTIGDLLNPAYPTWGWGGDILSRSSNKSSMILRKSVYGFPTMANRLLLTLKRK